MAQSPNRPGCKACATRPENVPDNTADTLELSGQRDTTRALDFFLQPPPTERSNDVDLNGTGGRAMTARVPDVDRERALDKLRQRAARCRNCDLWKRGTQTVFGSGPATARLMLVGEQPGDVEDVAGEPFVGPAGRLLREALIEAGADPAQMYLTNAVKHFKWEPRGKRRIHERPNREEILACRMWLEEEVALVQPAAIVALGATAVSALLGSKVRVMRDRGAFFPSALGPRVAVTVHPSSILRAPDATARAAARKAFVMDLRRIFRTLKESS
jgi:uracil-DNA glycosylase family protein